MYFQIIFIIVNLQTAVQGALNRHTFRRNFSHSCDGFYQFVQFFTSVFQFFNQTFNGSTRKCLVARLRNLDLYYVQCKVDNKDVKSLGSYKNKVSFKFIKYICTYI